MIGLFDTIPLHNYRIRPLGIAKSIYSKKKRLIVDLFPFYGVKWNNKYYFYTRLVFRSRSSQKIFDTLSQAVCWILENNYGVSHILHLLDDFLAVDAPNAEADRTMAIFSLVFNKLGIALRLPT